MDKKWILGVFVLSLILPGVANAQNEKDAGVKSYGVIHNIAEDREVEKVGGIYEPEGLDKYMKRKFDEVNVKMNAISVKIDALTASLKDIDAKINNLQPPPVDQEKKS
ncbi:MAG: hypothetical protein HYZ84_02460 [Candidatus Omnitrophica bacterium]|nr:hypothetical protein [Candidatus Omnitrophota bacterium]